MINWFPHTVSPWLAHICIVWKLTKCVFFKNCTRYASQDLHSAILNFFWIFFRIIQGPTFFRQVSLFRHMVWPFNILQNDNITISWDFLRLTAPAAMPGHLGAVSLKKSHDIVILSFCNILMGQAN